MGISANIIRCIRALLLLLLFSCSDKPPTIQIGKLFTLLPDNYTNLRFENTLADEKQFNVFKYRNYYNGGGVAIGDVNNDGLPDVYLTANQKPNKLFLNQGGFRFRDVTDQTGVAGSHNWSTGVCMADVDADGRLDIYVCNSGNFEGDNRTNAFFLNQGNGSDGTPVFREAAAEFGIADRGFSTHAAFFDYDRDGDLDLYVLNNAFRALSTFDISKNLRHERDDSGGGDRLYRNDRGKFVDASEEAGIYGSVIAFGLGVSVSDIDNDGWLDIYVANDFFERDYLYINNRDGTFSEKLEQMIRHVSLASMGCDIADVNNDGLMDIFSTDMLPEDDVRLKTTFTFDSFEFNERKIEWGYFHQFSQNALQLNNGFNSEEQFSFSEIGMLAGVAESDWSWGALIVDMDNDGLKDIFISNGIFRDVTDQDYMMFLMSQENIRKILQGDRIDIPELIQKIPSTKLRNYAFRNNGDLAFSNLANEWGLDTLSFSNGFAYGDLDNDGDNDLVINNVNQPAFVYRNEVDSLTTNNYLKVKLIGEGMNRFAIGAKVTLKCANRQLFVQEQMPMRGFQSSVDYALTFGLGKNEVVDTLIVAWPDGSCGITANIIADQVITLFQKDVAPRITDYASNLTPQTTPLFRDITENFPLQYRHVENDFNDFQREPLMPRKLSTEGPKIAIGDVNGDGLEDLYIGGAKGSAGKLLIQTASGAFKSAGESLFEKTKICEDVDAVFFDADADGDLDLYIVSGGNEYSTRAPALLDRLYINNGKGNFTHADNALPKFYASGSCVKPADFDGDGDTDLFVGSRSIPWQYGLTPESYLLENDGRGHFSNVTKKYAPELASVGMVTDAEWLDYNHDGDLDLVVVGEWMPVSLFRNTGEKLEDITEQVGLAKSDGWWNCVVVDDLNGDGYVDLVAGNWGLNSKLKASESEPVTIYIGDFDNNGRFEQILCYYKPAHDQLSTTNAMQAESIQTLSQTTNESQHRKRQSYPLPLRSDLMKQLPSLQQKFPTHADYAGKQITDILTKAQLHKAVVKKAYTFASTIFYGKSDGAFLTQPLPKEAQFSPVYAIMARDFDADGTKDLLLTGNFFDMLPQLGRNDASYGTLLLGDGASGLTAVPMWQSGLSLTGQIRDVVSFKLVNKQEVYIFAKNDERIQVYEMTAK